MREPKDQNANVNVNQEASDLRTQKFIIPTQMVFGQILIKHFASFFLSMFLYYAEHEILHGFAS